jgi:ATP-dependent exoDNAse (exonuclease V) beta subunit
MLEATISPGLHVPELGSHRVVWWDPATLSLNRQTDVALRRQEILSEDPGGEQARLGAEANAAWEATRAQRIERAQKPSVEVMPIRAVPAPGPDAPKREFPIEASAGRREGRPSGKRFGALVHGILSRAPLDAEPDALEPLARFFARVYGNPESEQRAAVEAVHAALQHPVLRRARSAKELRRESAVSLPLSPSTSLGMNGALGIAGASAEGALDLAFADADGWTVVEFKTDSAESVDAAYHRQLGLYVEAVSQATGAPAGGVILLV